MDTVEPVAGDALLIVDVQQDFLPGGSLGVPDGEAVLAPLNRYIEMFARKRLPICATRDWHPAGHCSFGARGGPWPAHCIAGSQGAQFPPGLHLPPETIVVSKGMAPEAEAYSGFAGTGLDAMLHANGVHRLFVGGLATDYCVINTVRDALRLGYQVILLHDAVRAVDATPGDGARAEAAMLQAGAHMAELRAEPPADLRAAAF